MMRSFSKLVQGMALTAVVVLAGCADGVELNGKIFDALGVSGSADQKKLAGGPKVQERQGLVVPPDLARLPQPGSGKADESQSLGAMGVADADERKRLAQADLERQQAEYCKKHYETQKALGQMTMADTARGPLGRCTGNSILQGFIPKENR